MRYQPLGGSGLLVSVVGLGCNNFGGRIDAAATRAVVDAAIDAGVTLFDTADIYGNAGGSETLLGETLGRRRDQVVLATKFGHQDHDMGYPAARGQGRPGVRPPRVEQSMRRLRTDHIDLYQLHTPDPVTPMEETLAALTSWSWRARSATWGTRTSPAGRSRTRRTSRRRAAGRRSCRRRTSTRCLSASGA